MLSVNLRGGLGNQLFQLAAAETIASQTNRTMVLTQTTTPPTHHSRSNYFETILRQWAPLIRSPMASTTIREPSYALQPWTTLIPDDVPCVTLEGYFQNVGYIPASFCSRLELPSVSVDPSSVFLHVRGGDYVGHPLHDMQLGATYYPWAISQFPSDTHFLVLTNDIPYAKTLPCLSSVSHSFLNVDELHALSVMQACAGGICANSTFSWWGAYLRPERPIVVPSRWFHDPTIVVDGYFVPGWIKGPV